MNKLNINQSLGDIVEYIQGLQEYSIKKELTIAVMEIEH
ncbi:hypothetical protein J2S18_002214 [Eubacterium multiforme]|uniref:Uncharacterized protein n=1 Tax=Eubacterium multiforme TaxID=83339 RepID=A0ABT9UVC8_9FIRM|nr:hypothetical protein [Eubacterium multiforme]